MEKLDALLIDDDVSFCKTFALLSTDLFNLTIAHSSRDGLNKLEAACPEVVLLDYKLKENKNGLDVLKEIRTTHPDLPVIIVTEVEDIDLAVKAMRLGATDFTTKTPNLRTLRVRLEGHLNEMSWRLLCRSKDDQLFGRLVYRSQAMNELIEKAQSMAGADLPLLIQGESGTGKSLLAREIHQRSFRRHRPFVAVNCGNLSPNLFESELFGHEKGAYTDATTPKKGKLELANAGTLFLDEICALPFESQAKILTAIEEHRFERLGAEHSVSVDVRIIAATNANIEECIRANRFREDLYYRLNGMILVIPPLRQRKDDIEPLAVYFLAAISKGAATQISPSALRELERYHWPGNIRELKNVIDSSAIQRRPVTELKEICWSSQRTPAAHTIDLTELLTLPYEEAMKKLTGDFQTLYFTTLLAQHGDNVTAAAEAAGVNRATIHRFLKKS